MVLQTWKYSFQQTLSAFHFLTRSMASSVTVVAVAQRDCEGHCFLCGEGSESP